MLQTCLKGTEVWAVQSPHFRYENVENVALLVSKKIRLLNIVRFIDRLREVLKYFFSFHFSFFMSHLSISSTYLDVSIILKSCKQNIQLYSAIIFSLALFASHL
jgi:hypothetical protein